MKSNNQTQNALIEFCEIKGAPLGMHMDGAKEFVQGQWQDTLSQHGGVKETFAQPYTPWQSWVAAGNIEHEKQAPRAL